ncbi:MAG: cytochrome c [Acidobacteriota bacterium]
MRVAKVALVTSLLAVAGFALYVTRDGAAANDEVGKATVEEAPYQPRPAGMVTFNKDIARIMFNNCTSCHRPGEVAPFALLSYQDAKKRAKQIADVTGSRFMPPWKAEHSDYSLKGARRLTADEMGLIKQWADEGMPEGRNVPLPAMPKFIDGWQLGKPDLVVKMGEPFPVPADGPDIYRNFALPLSLAEDKWIRAIEFRPAARSVVHHSLFFFEATGSARKLDEEDPKPGYSGGMGGISRGLGGFGSGGGRIAQDGAAKTGATFGSLGGWAVGGQGKELPEGLAWFVPKGADLVLSTHFHPSGKSESEASTVGIYFAKEPPTRRFTGVQLPPLFGFFEGIEIPAGEKEYKIEDSFILPVDVKGIGVGAHAHYLAKRMKMTATLPNGESKVLLSINDWDFSWQDQYQFEQFVSLPRGTKLTVSIIYDNSAENPRNPSSPPKKVEWGEGSTDEMGSMSLMVVAGNESELPELQQSIAQHVRRSALKTSPIRLLRQMRRD